MVNLLIICKLSSVHLMNISSNWLRKNMSIMMMMMVMMIVEVGVIIIIIIQILQYISC